VELLIVAERWIGDWLKCSHLSKCGVTCAPSRWLTKLSIPRGIIPLASLYEVRDVPTSWFRVAETAVAEVSRSTTDVESTIVSELRAFNFLLQSCKVFYFRFAQWKNLQFFMNMNAISEFENPLRMEREHSEYSLMPVCFLEAEVRIMAEVFLGLNWQFRRCWFSKPFRQPARLCRHLMESYFSPELSTDD